jgi:PEP-CTERM motif-containing protein
MRTRSTFRLLVGALVISTAMAVSAGAETIALTCGSTPIPEPATMVLIGGGIGMMLAIRRRDERKAVSQKKTRTK